jgi:hypothetical protein
MDEKEDPVEEIAKTIESWIRKVEEVERRLKLLASSSYLATSYS